MLSIFKHYASLAGDARERILVFRACAVPHLTFQRRGNVRSSQIRVAPQEKQYCFVSPIMPNNLIKREKLRNLKKQISVLKVNKILIKVQQIFAKNVEKGTGLI